MKLFTNYLFYLGIFLLYYFEFILANNGCWYHYYLPKFLNPSNNDNSERLLFTDDNEYLSGF